MYVFFGKNLGVASTKVPQPMLLIITVFELNNYSSDFKDIKINTVGLVIPALLPPSSK